MAKFTLTDKHGKKQHYNFLGDSIAVVQLAGLILVKEKAKTSKPSLRKNALTPEEESQ